MVATESRVTTKVLKIVGFFRGMGKNMEIIIFALARANKGGA
jgi:hypothetical protein